MPRNPKSPKEYIDQEPRKRSAEKLDKVISWLVQFHYSTRKVLLEMLRLNINSHHIYFKNLEEKKIIKRTEAYAIRSDIYLLTQVGKELAAEKNSTLFIDYLTDSIKINHNNLRHNLAVQKIVIKLMKERDYTSFSSEKYIATSMNCSFDKNPDALLAKLNENTMIEVELTAKSDRRIFKAFSDHLKGLSNQSYQKVIYVFSNPTLRNYYKIRFEQEIWPEYFQNEKGIWIRHSQNSENLIMNFKKNFEFYVDETLLKDF